MKYKLINKQTGEEHICDKVTIDGMDSTNSDSGVSENFLNKEEYIANLNFNALDNEQKNS